MLWTETGSTRVGGSVVAGVGRSLRHFGGGIGASTSSSSTHSGRVKRGVVPLPIARSMIDVFGWRAAPVCVAAAAESTGGGRAKRGMVAPWPIVRLMIGVFGLVMLVGVMVVERVGGGRSRHTRCSIDSVRWNALLDEHRRKVDVQRRVVGVADRTLIASSSEQSEKDR